MFFTFDDDTKGLPAASSQAASQREAAAFPAASQKSLGDGDIRYTFAGDGDDGGDASGMSFGSGVGADDSFMADVFGDSAASAGDSQIDIFGSPSEASGLLGSIARRGRSAEDGANGKRARRLRKCLTPSREPSVSAAATPAVKPSAKRGLMSDRRPATTDCREDEPMFTGCELGDGATMTDVVAGVMPPLTAGPEARLGATATAGTAAPASAPSPPGVAADGGAAVQTPAPRPPAGDFAGFTEAPTEPSTALVELPGGDQLLEEEDAVPAATRKRGRRPADEGAAAADRRRQFVRKGLDAQDDNRPAAGGLHMARVAAASTAADAGLAEGAEGQAHNHLKMWEDVKRRSEDLLVPSGSFEAIARASMPGGFRIQKNAVRVLHAATESWITGLCSDALTMAAHARRVTIMARDIRLAVRIACPDARVAPW